MQNFEIEIPNPKRRIYRLMSMLIAGMNLLSFAIAAFHFETTLSATAAWVGILINLLLLVILIANKQNSWRKLLQSGWVFIISAIIWFMLASYWIAISLLAFGIAEIINQRKNIVRINEEGLRYPSFPEQTYPWESIHQLMLKDGVLSMDLEGNRFLQFTIPETNLSGIDVETFNRYCIQKISESEISTN